MATATEDEQYAIEAAERHALNRAQTEKAQGIRLAEIAKKDPFVASLLKDHESRGAEIAKLRSELAQAADRLTEVEKQLNDSKRKK